MNPRQQILAFDCSTSRCVIALAVHEKVLSIDIEAGNTHSQILLPGVMQLLDRANIELKSLDGIAFGEGPGSFTGVRIACASAQGLALGAGLNVVPFSTLAAIAQSCGASLPRATKVWVVNDARMKEVYAAGFEKKATGQWIETIAARALAPEAALPPDESWSLGGDGVAIYEPLQKFAPQVLQACLNSEGVMAAAVQAYTCGAVFDARDAQPRYVRDRIALTEAERAAGQSLTQ